MTLAELITWQGHNPDAVLAEISATNAMLDALGLAPDSDPRRVTITGSAPSQPVLSYKSGTYEGLLKMQHLSRWFEIARPVNILLIDKS